MKKLLLGLTLCAAALLGAAEAGIQTFTLGNLKFTAFQDAPSSMPVTLFKGADEAELKKLVPDGKAEASVNVFFLHLDGKNILVDTGNGGKRGSLSAKMKQAGIGPDEIDIVLLTHMHGDHIGGLVDGDKAVFPKAEIYVSEPELAYWESSKNQLAHRVIEAYGDRIKVFKSNGAVIPGVTALSAPGHTPGHTVYELDSIMVIGDLLHAAAIQFPRPEFCPTYDMDAAKAVATRKEFFEKAAQSGKLVAGMHLPFPGIGIIAKDKSGAYHFKPAVQGGELFDYAAFFKENPLGVFATMADGDQVKTRFFQYLFSEKHRAYFCTGAEKAVYAQLRKRPSASFCSSPKDYSKVVSINGKVVFVDDPGLKKKVLDENPSIKAIYKTPENPNFKLLYIDVEAVETFSFAEGTKKYRLK